MNSLSRAHRAVRPGLVLLVAALLGGASVPVLAGTPPPPAASVLPPLPPQDHPWLYKGSDVPRDREWIFGQLPNGLRWAVRRNGVPPGQVSIRIAMDVGSLHERPGEEGFAHLLEHLVFRQSKYLGEAQAIPTWQRLGATFGSDTNAETTPTHTVFKIDLPGATPASIDESMKLLSGMMIAPTLSESDIRAEVPIVLAEKRERGGAAERVQNALRETLYAGLPLGDHPTIGRVETISNARQDTVRAFHARWYRPENAVIVMSGDADPALLAALAAKWFGGWRGQGPLTPPPSFGEPKRPEGADPANPVAQTRVVVEPELPRALTFVHARGWHEHDDTVAYNKGLMIDQVAQAIVNRRLEARARAGAAYLAAQVVQENISRSIDGTFVNITPLDGNWRAALRDVRAAIADAVSRPPTTEEIAREVAEINVTFESLQQQRSLQPGGKLADDLVQALDIHETVASPEVVLDIFRQSIPMFTPQAVLEHSRSLFTAPSIRAIYVTPQAGEADAAALKAALQEKVSASTAARAGGKPVSFADLPAIGAPGKLVGATPTGLLEIEQLAFANGVRVLLWPTRDDPGRASVKVRFGSGFTAFQPADAPYVTLGNMALVPSGEGKLGQDELERISTGRKMGFEFKIDDGSFSLSAETRREDLDDQLYLFAAKFAMPRWDPQPVLRAIAASKLQYESYAASPQGVLSRDLKYLQRGRDPRYRPPSPAELATATPEGFRKAWAPVLAQGPIEVQVYGDIDRLKTIAALARTFGALPARQPAAAVPSVAVPAPSLEPIVLHHRGDANQAAVAITWPTGGGSGGIAESRQLEVLSQLVSNRLLEAMREKLGASYAPQVASDWPVDLANGGTITAMAQVQPEMAPRFFTAADAIAADLARKPVGGDELARVVEPLRQQVTRAATSTAFFMWQLEGATQDPRRFAMLGSVLRDYTAVTPAQLQALAAKYLVREKAWRLEVLPEAPGSGQAERGTN
ncbi:MAG: insulinase family protein [Sphingomonadales bacterium]|nr:insulinase family protein [Sphingomonadales bacterium]